MIQRIQSVYLLIAAIFMAVIVCSPLAILTNAEGFIYTFDSLGILDENSAVAFPTWGVLVIEVLVSLLSLIAVFLYKNRKAQIKLCYTSLILIVVFFGTFTGYLFAGEEALNLSFIRIGYGLAFPIVSFILIILALSKIKADEKLIQSLNRIR